MTVIPITCDNCGAKYKLPPTFKGSQAKCQKCGSVIDVLKQRAGATDTPADAKAPASARPAAAARPAVDRSKQKPAGREQASREQASAAATDKPERPSRSRAAAGGRSHGAGKDDGDGGAPRRGRAERQQKSKQMPMVLGAVGLLAIVVVVVVFMMQGDKKPAAEEQAKNTPAAVKPAADQAADTGMKTDAGQAPADGDKPPMDPKPDDGSKAADASGEKDPAADPEAGSTKPTEAAADKPAETPADPGDPSRVQERWEKMKNPPQTMDQIVPAKERVGDITWPAGIDEAKKAVIRELCSDVLNGGRAEIRAKPKLVEIGYPALFGIVEKLRDLNYCSTEESMTAFVLNKVMEDITGGLNAGFAPVGATEDIPVAKAEWNTRTVTAWIGALAKFPDEEAFLKNKRERADKQK